jgi:glycerol-3-phosphate dehydrogenase
MKRDLQALAAGEFDVVVIGAGILGAGVARDAALRGLNVALIDKGDFASGTSSRSSKLIHGGFRYLEQKAFGLVAESCRERGILREIAPHLVKPQPFLLPVYEGNPRSLGKMRWGMRLYDLMARYRNVARHRVLSPERALMKEPMLGRTGLRGAILFYDCQEDDARFCLENIHHASDSGAVCANYCELTGFVTQGDRLLAGKVMDRLGMDKFEIRARTFINAAGPWVERVANLTALPGESIVLSPTKGVHLVLPKLTEQHGIFFQARRDRRFLFVIPYAGHSLVGTTDTDYTGNADDARAEPRDVEYLIDETRALMPRAEINMTDVITTTAGVRTLLKAEGIQPSARSREHRIARHGQNLLSVAGGKYTTYRAIAEEVVDVISEVPCRTAITPLPHHFPPAADLATRVAYACEEEMAMTVSDVMRRRMTLALGPEGGSEEVTERVARLMAAAHGWNEGEMNWHLNEYREEWRRALP